MTVEEAKAFGIMMSRVSKALKVSELGPNEAFYGIQQMIIDSFQSNEFLKKCKQLKGETACLFVIRKQNFLWWLSIGDCVLYVYHPELAQLGEYQQNHRSFYEWIGQESTFQKAVPCYSSGVKELRQGKNHIFLTTDGLIECPNTNFGNPSEILKRFEKVSNREGVQSLLEEINEKDVRDSTTILSWKILNKEKATMPSDL
ncbi:protein phosphatase 2C domain-containing protein [Radiobacillus kanasensis]|uniref:protein phosphatase 2C domain-containing protein n=1 Tax=Radiobacillus kanasensis TaxID=2844358 RepID=UPI001E4B16D8|nr:protein phosphatase 2C domain-containing protein [Radiobacillus kanasensis]UFU00105.1 protein phosphatase 2C domain-containing protein [Radiobacillus kanasensis]